MEYRSYADLSQTITANLYKIPPGVDLIVGIPRSGLLAGNLIALALNVPITDLDGFIQNKKLRFGITRKLATQICYPRQAAHVLVVDDSIYAGESMNHARNLIGHVSGTQKMSYCAVYANPKSLDRVDIFFETLASPGCQEWNVMHRDKLENFCLDIDGVLCRNPKKAEDDDGPAYRRFIRNATPLMLPSHTAGCLVTGRLEKYRKETICWLNRNGVKFKKLHMLDLPDAKTRWKQQAAAKFKAEVFKNYPDSLLFIESDPREAAEIARLSGKKVLCFENQKIYSPEISMAMLDQKVRKYQNGIIRRARRIAQLLAPSSRYNMGDASLHKKPDI